MTTNTLTHTAYDVAYTFDITTQTYSVTTAGGNTHTVPSMFADALTIAFVAYHPDRVADLPPYPVKTLSDLKRINGAIESFNVWLHRNR
jgi:hypothetical protein